MPERRTYEGRCHCGAVRFRVRTDEIVKGCRCNCSICTRRGAVMSDVYFPPEDVEIEGLEKLSLYMWGDLMVRAYFCPTCGVYAFHDATDRTGHYRVNLGCLEGVDPLAVEIRLIDGKSF